MMSELDLEIHKRCLSANSNVIYVAETAGELLYLTSYRGKLTYCGDKSLENEKLAWICDSLDPRDVVISVYGVKTLDYLSTFCSLIRYSSSDSALLGIRKYVVLGPQNRWRGEVKERGLWDKFLECIDLGYGLGIFDKKQYSSLTAERPWSNYDMTRFRGSNNIVYSE